MAVAAWLRSVYRRCYGCRNLGHAVSIWYPERLKQIVDVPVPQIEEEVAEVNRFFHYVNQ